LYSRQVKSGRGVHRNADALVAPTLNAWRSPEPRVTIARTTSSRTGAVTNVSKHLARDFAFKGGVSKQLLQLVVFDLEILQPLRARETHAAELAAPKRLARPKETVVPTEILHRHAGIDLAQEPDNLCFREPFLHRPTLRIRSDSRSKRYSIPGGTSAGLKNPKLLRSLRMSSTG
jgi:hypothetical protein